MGDQRIEARVLGNDVEVGLGVALGKPPDVIGDVEIQRIRPVAGDPHVLGPGPEHLHRSREFDRQFRLVGADEDDDPEMFLRQQRKILRLHVLVVDEYVVRAHVRAFDP